MRLRHEIAEALERAAAGQGISPADALACLSVDLDAPEFYALCAAANRLSREQFQNQADVCAQIGLDFAPCSRNCGFCSFSREAGLVRERLTWDIPTVVAVARGMAEAGANAIYLMSTADYPFARFLEVGAAVRQALPPSLPLVANTGDLSAAQAQQLRAAGFSAVYHALRLREGRDTRIPPERRRQTIAHARAAGLAVQVCLEPVGPEHDPRELVEQMFWARETGVSFNGAMRRTAVPGTRLAGHGEITYRELARAVAVARLVMGDAVQAHCTHEPNLPSLLAGANLIWAEAGPNPRDTVPDTAAGRGQTVENCRRILHEAGWQPRRGASPACRP